jgi:hypothetical protein
MLRLQQQQMLLRSKLDRAYEDRLSTLDDLHKWWERRLRLAIVHDAVGPEATVSIFEGPYKLDDKSCARVWGQFGLFILAALRFWSIAQAAITHHLNAAALETALVTLRPAAELGHRARDAVKEAFGPTVLVNARSRCYRRNGHDNGNVNVGNADVDAQIQPTILCRVPPRFDRLAWHFHNVLELAGSIQQATGDLGKASHLMTSRIRAAFSRPTPRTRINAPSSAVTTRSTQPNSSNSRCAKDGPTPGRPCSM